ncbi:MAG: NAD(P)-dependent oxidoreductase [Phycisphaeraceae bacterium]
MSEPTPQPHRILLTGSAGAIGRVIGPALATRGYHVRGFDTQARPCESRGASLAGINLDTRIGDITDAATVLDAMQGIDTLIHLAAEPNDADFITRLLPANVVGLFNVMDAARQAGVRRIVLASSMQVVSGHRLRTRTAPLRIEDGPAPTNHYALTKVWAESMGEMYARVHRLSVIAVRLGWFVRNRQEAARVEQHQAHDHTLSHDDAVRFFARCVESDAPAPGECAVLFALSRARGTPPCDLEPAQRIIGYIPHDSYPQGTHLT